MEVIHEEANFKTLSFKRGEEIMSVLKNYLTESGVKAAHITGLGAADVLEIAYYNLKTREYEKHTINEELEIVNLTGNVGVKEDGEIIIHMHGTFGKRDLSVIGGHIFSIRVYGAGELHLKIFSGEINRAQDKETGLNLMCNISPDL